MKEFIRNNRLALSVYLLAIVIAFGFIVSVEKHAIHLFVNQYVGNRYANAFFYWATYLGDGHTAPFLLLAIYISNARAGVYATFSIVFASAITWCLKHYVYDDVDRPSFVFQYIDRHPLNLVKDVELSIHNSFPSGHTTQAFSLFMSMVFAARKQAFKLLFVICAILAGFSRVYLSQHWLSDVVAGSLIGTIASVLFYFVFVYHNRFPVLNKPLTAIFRRA